MTNRSDTYDAVVAGAGPVGLLLAISLGRLGVRTLLLEKSQTPAAFPKMDRCNPRTMEMFRRLGFAQQVRDLGYPADNPMDVILMMSLSEPSWTTLNFPSVAACREIIDACQDGSQPLEPYQLVSQNTVEPFLKSVAETTPNVTVRYGCGFVRYEQDTDGVTVQCETADGDAIVFRAAYLVGCDGGKSAVRKQMGIELRGQGGLMQLTQVIFSSDDLYERVACGKGRHYCFPQGGSITAQGSRKEFTFHSAYPEDSDFPAILRDRIGFECDVRITHIVPWKHHLLLADKYRDRRVLIAGDAAHLVIPNGGLGMNSGVGDAIDLAWKLAGVVKGWGGPKLLDAYEGERRPVAERNIEASGLATRSVPKWLRHYTPQVSEDTPLGRRAKRRLIEAFRTHHITMYRMLGVELGYTYAWSDIVADEPDNVPHWDVFTYEPRAQPGARIPHMWLTDGRALQDVLSEGYTLLDLARKGPGDLEGAFAKIGAPFEYLPLREARLRTVYGADLLLLRPDLHIAWRGDAPPQDASQLARLVTGH